MVNSKHALFEINEIKFNISLLKIFKKYEIRKCIWLNQKY